MVCLHKILSGGTEQLAALRGPEVQSHLPLGHSKRYGYLIFLQQILVVTHHYEEFLQEVQRELNPRPQSTATFHPNDSRTKPPKWDRIKKQWNLIKKEWDKIKEQLVRLNFVLPQAFD